MNQTTDFEVSAAEMNRRFGEIRDRAQTGTVTITRHGKPSLVLLSIERFAALSATSGLSADALRRNFGLILDNLTEGYIGVDGDWRITTVNRVAEMFVGRARDELVGTLFHDVFPDAASATDQVARTMNSGAVIVSERASESHPHRRVAVTSFPLPAPDGGVGVLFVNVTERTRREAAINEAEATVAALFDALHDCVLVLLDKDDRVLRWSAGAERLLGWTSAEVIGRPYADLLVAGSTTDQPRFAARDGGVIKVRSTARAIGEQRTLYVLRPV